MDRTGKTGMLSPQSAIREFALCVGATIFLMASLAGAVAQAPSGSASTPAVPAAPPPASVPAPPPSDKKDGFFDAFGRWWDKSAADFKASVDESNAKWRQLSEQTDKAAKDAATASKEAADAFANLSKMRVIEGRQICETTPTGSADCNAAAEVICKGKGFASGKSADIQTHRKCSARAWMSGSPSDKDCRVETIVVKAACQ